MKLSDFFEKKHEKVVVIVQCRLSSTRLPRKALLPLAGKCILEWTLNSMKRVPADKYFLAVDTESEQELSGIAKKYGWEIFAGSQSDVLDRFCRVIELSKADYVVRATADNPFLFWENAIELIDEFKKKNISSPVDYMTFTGLPHGSGVEMFNAHSLLKAEKLTSDPYDHEHVGPALYNHKDQFNCVFLKASRKYFYPSCRTTVDTPADYRRALAMARFVPFSYSTEDVVNALTQHSVSNPVLLVPSVQKGHGTGHLRRMLDVAAKIGADIYIPLEATLEQTASLVSFYRSQGLYDYQIVRDLSNISMYSLAVLDMFCTEKSLYEEISSKCPVCALDEGSLETDWADYLLDILPSSELERKSNRTEVGFIDLPKNQKPLDSTRSIHTALVVLGGEDPASLAFPASFALARNGVYTTVILNDASKEEEFTNLSEEEKKYLKIISPVENLKEKLYEYDLIVTHYGFTAFEAVEAGCAVILLGTTDLHQKLSLSYGFTCLSNQNVNEKSFAELLSNTDKLYIKDVKRTEKKNIFLSDFITELSLGESLECPVCQKKNKVRDALVSRTPYRTFRRCKTCGMLYQSWTLKEGFSDYSKSYFFEDYEKQYGKTYLSDFANIKSQGVRRTSIINQIYHHSHSSVTPSLLDIGCAMGPFLDAASDSGWQVFGTDISEDAVLYVQKNLNYPALCASFPEADVTGVFGVDKFDAVTMWYVIEHFKNLDSILREVNRILKKGGVFAFSTPSASGVSGKYNTDSFFASSPADHYSLWELDKTSAILKKYGFKVVKIVSTGIHPERFPKAKEKNYKKDSIQFKILKLKSRIFKLGDTFEVYAKKISDVCAEKENEQ